MYSIGRVCMKIAGRDAGKMCVVVDQKEGRYLVDGQTRRKLVNPNHLEPTKTTTDVKKGASHDDVVKALGKVDIVVEHPEAKYTRKVKAEKKPEKK